MHQSARSRHTFLLGVVIGDVSAYVGGAVDTVIQRIIES